MEPVISIVVPIFNMEAYLSRCLDSLLAQTFPNIEIIAVNDGSTDGTDGLLMGYAALDSRIQVIRVENGGVSAARNIGLGYCRGRYIGFVDPDDWVDAEMYGTMYDEAVKHHADIVMCGYVREFGGHSKPKPFPLPDGTLYLGEEVQLQLTRRLIGPLGAETGLPESLDAWGTVWSKLYRAELLQGGGGLFFTDLKAIGSNEDTLFNVSVCSRAQSFLFLNRPYYHYWRASAGSITTRYKPELLRQFKTLYGKMAEFVRLNALGGEYSSALQNRISLNVLGLGLNIVGDSNPAPARKKIGEIKRLLGDATIRSALLSFDSSACSLPWKVFYGLAKRRWAAPLYAMLYGIEGLRTKKWTRRRRSGANRAGAEGQAVTASAER
ncbi:glycosyltransferase family 2 protein [Paenibacillus sp. GCM10027627]|uniref:glycosyltransferase family 2 protein n=1 Tax=unclassified Paenibacillus TaxID=185978 RepID=UPI003627A23D